ncbi:hypothetical protein GCM10010439_55120 [Actinocorallia aurantiaca]|uniref:Uncharacterized protein n=1 Tax=Actinocorallia aurantiaca TaxID=46204 RepID=A0ABN3UJE8_9ACTN
MPGDGDGGLVDGEGGAGVWAWSPRSSWAGPVGVGLWLVGTGTAPGTQSGEGASEGPFRESSGEPLDGAVSAEGGADLGRGSWPVSRGLPAEVMRSMAEGEADRAAAAMVTAAAPASRGPFQPPVSQDHRPGRDASAVRSLIRCSPSGAGVSCSASARRARRRRSAWKSPEVKIAPERCGARPSRAPCGSSPRRG